MHLYRTYFGPTITASAAAGAEQQDDLWTGIEEVVRCYNRAEDGTVIVQAEYLQTVAARSAA